jgi:hypothetical protein
VSLFGLLLVLEGVGDGGASSLWFVARPATVAIAAAAASAAADAAAATSAAAMRLELKAWFRKRGNETVS